jgi:large subunit ribosomal protein L6
MFKKEIKIVGVGYGVRKEGNLLYFQVGKSHEEKIKIPEGMKVECEKTSWKIEGSDKMKVHTFADEIRRLRKPEPYKGKGIIYVDEKILRKKGKKK